MEKIHASMYFNDRQPLLMLYEWTICGTASNMWQGARNVIFLQLRNIPNSHPASCPKGQWGSFPTEMRPGHGDDHPHPPAFSKEVKKGLELYLHLLLYAFVTLYRVKFTLLLLLLLLFLHGENFLETGCIFKYKIRTLEVHLSRFVQMIM